MKYKPTYLRHVVRRFENACDRCALAGSAQPDTFAAISAEYTASRKALLRVMDTLNDLQAPGIAPGSCSVMPKDRNGG